MSKKEPTKDLKTEVEIGEYKGSPTLTIHDLDINGNRKPYPFGFGKKKAQLIIRHLEEIKSFAENS